MVRTVVALQGAFLLVGVGRRRSSYARRSAKTARWNRRWGPAVTEGSSELDSSVVAAALQRLRGAAGAAEAALPEALVELDVAHEELRVAEEELRTQQETIDELLAADRQRRAQQLAVSLPVALWETDADGRILYGNPAAAKLLGLPAARLDQRVLLTFAELADRRSLRQGLSDLAAGDHDHVQVDVTFHGRDERSRRVRLFGWRDAPHGPVLLRWLGIELPDGAAVQAPPALPTAAESPSSATAMARAFAELVLVAPDSTDEQRLLRRIVSVVRGAVPGATALSVCIGPPVEPELVATDEAVAQVFDGRQMTAGEGPCQEAYEQRTVVVTADVTADDRWPRLRHALTDASVCSVLAVPAQLPDERWVVLNIYSDHAGVFTGDSVHLGQMLAAAIVAILQEAAERAALKALAANLEAALTSRAIIDQAKGVLIARHGGSAEQAFARLAELSQALNVKVRDLAPLVVAGNPDVLAALDRP